MNRMRVWGGSSVWLLVGSLAVSACESTTTTAVTKDVATSLSITTNGSGSTQGDGQLVLAVGDTITVTATAINPLGLAVSTGVITWSSADTSIVQVSTSGLVRGVGVGASEVHASWGEATGALATVVQDSTSF